MDDMFNSITKFIPCQVIKQKSSPDILILVLRYYLSIMVDLSGSRCKTKR